MAFFNNFKKVGYLFPGGHTSSILDIFRYVAVDDNLIDQSVSYRYYEIQDGDRPDVVSHKLYNTPDYYWTLLVVNRPKSSMYGLWPLGTNEFNQYMDKVYPGQIVNARPNVVFNTDGQYIQTENSIADRFQVGEKVTGFLSGATGTVADRFIQLNQLLIQDTTGTFIANELVVGELTQDQISTYEVFPYELAPHHYEDADGIGSDNGLFIVGAPSSTELDTITNREWEEARNDDLRFIRVVKPEYIEDFVIDYKKKIRQGIN
jgi:hypothetical protein